MTTHSETSVRIELMGRTGKTVFFPVQELHLAEHVRYAGFGARIADRLDFFVAPVGAAGESGFDVPDWQSDLVVRLQDRTWRRVDFRNVRIVDLIFFRKFVADTNCGVVAFWYRPALTDSIFPADPMFPWGGDFYRFLRHVLGFGA